MNFVTHSAPLVAEERKRLGLSQDEAGAACGVSREMWGKYERSKAAMGGEVLYLFAQAGADVQYIVTGKRRGDGIGESAIHQAVLNAVDLLSLSKKIDAQQLASAVLKLIDKTPPPSSATNQQSVMGGTAQQFNAPISGGVAGRNIIHKTRKKAE